MPQFLTTIGVSYNIEQLIIDAEEELMLVTPFLQLSQNLIERLGDNDKKGIKTTLIYGKSKLNPTESKILSKFKNLEVYFCKNLHAKCYHNGKTMVISSMNLYEFSERNNREMGILIDINNDPDVFKDATKEIDSIINASELKQSIGDNRMMYDSLIKFNPRYMDDWYFHLPSVYNILKKKYSEYEISFKDDYIFIKEFPTAKTYMTIYDKIDLLFINKKHFEDIEQDTSINDKLNQYKYRFFFNYKQINIYNEQGYQPKKNFEGLKDYTYRVIDIIDIIYETFK